MAQCIIETEQEAIRNLIADWLEYHARRSLTLARQNGNANNPKSGHVHVGNRLAELAQELRKIPCIKLSDDHAFNPMDRG